MLSSIKLKAAPTFRDLGGIVAGDGRCVRQGQFFRAGNLIAPAIHEETLVRDLGLRRVFDLRSAVERQRHPSLWASYSAASTINCDVNEDVRSGSEGLLHLLQGDLSAYGAREMMLHNYRNFASGFARQLHGLFDMLLDETGLPVLIHCTAGKDRTGFACAMVLHALGVDDEQIYMDYLLTGDVLVESPVADSMAKFLSDILGHQPSPEAIAVIMGVRREFMETALASVCVQYGDIDTYLEQVAGLSVERREQLRQRLLA